jgi:CRP-like cAMP-binding protein
VATILSDASPLQNRLLATLPAEVRERLFPHLQLTRLALGQTLYDAGAVLQSAYFPTSAIISILYTMENGSRGEIAVVGNDGFVGVSLIMGGETTSNKAVVQSEGYGYRVSASDLLREFRRHGVLLDLLLRYTQALMTQMVQTAACNRHHSIDEQMARWMLLTLDRLTGNRIVMTQQLIANMLSISYARVSEVARRLQNLGVINYRDGVVEVLNRPMLETLSCECYSVVREESERLFTAST